MNKISLLPGFATLQPGLQ